MGMSKQTAALKLALEALEYASTGNRRPEIIELAITAIREALAEQDEYGSEFVEMAEQPAQPAKLKVTLEDRPIDIELAQYKRMFEAACSALGQIGDALGCDPEEGGAEPILAAIAELKAEQPAQQQEPVSDRENSIIRFALHQFMSNAYAHLTAAAQDKEGKRYPSEAVEKFAKDAEDAQALLKRLQFTSPPAQRKPWVGLTDVEWMNIVNKDHAWFGQRPEDVAHEVAALVEAKLREKNQ